MSFPQSTETPGFAHDLPAGSERPRGVADGRVADACSKGILSCSSFATVAEMGHQMAAHRIHSLIVWQAGGARWGVVTDVDVALAALSRPDAVADDLAKTAPSIESDASLLSAVTLMREQRTSHLVVIDSASERPTGILSALDIAGMAGWAQD
ncbi:MAG: CBS domain-containing protein [Solirubrobacteraceae bacterium]|jgi:CBS domain-containing protein